MKTIKHCPGCNKDFESTNPLQNVCSRTCRERIYRINKGQKVKGITPTITEQVKLKSTKTWDELTLQEKIDLMANSPKPHSDTIKLKFRHKPEPERLNQLQIKRIFYAQNK